MSGDRMCSELYPEADSDEQTLITQETEQQATQQTA